jgi:hypothetical protein
MPAICRFYPGITPRVFRALTMQELSDLIEYMNDVHKREEQQHRA